MKMRICNRLIISVLGGGNFGSLKLASNHSALTKGRIAAWIQALVFVLFVFLFSACSSEENADNSGGIDLKTKISAHEWAISKAYQRVGNFTLDVDAGTVYCQFTADSVYFSEEKTVTEIDEEGKILQTSTEIVPHGHYAYIIKENKILIDNQTFTISTPTGTFVLENEDWKIVLVAK